MTALDCSEESGWKPDHGPKEELAQAAAEIFISNRDMLDDYFSIKVDKDGHLCSLPYVIGIIFYNLHE